MANPNGFEYWRSGNAPSTLAGVPTGGTIEYWRGSRVLRLIASGVAGVPGIAARVYAFFVG